MGLSSRLRREGWVKIIKDKPLILTEEGAEMASGVGPS
jgi:Mn-dependent DtxR family transcriptional regulator